MKILILLLLLSIPSYASNECNKPKANLLHKSECDFNSGQISRSRASLEKLKSTTGPEVHDFIDYKIIKLLLLEESNNTASSIAKFKSSYQDSPLLKEIEILNAKNLLLLKEFNNLDKSLKYIKENYKLNRKEVILLNYLSAFVIKESGKIDNYYKSMVKIWKNHPDFKAERIQAEIKMGTNKSLVKITDSDLEQRLLSLFKNRMYKQFLKEYKDDLSANVLIKKALILIKVSNPQNGIKILERIASTNFESTGSQSKDLEIIAEAKYQLVLISLKESNNNSAIASNLKLILKNYPNFSKNNEIAYLSARLFTLDQNYSEAIKIYNWLIKTKSKNYLDKSFWGLGWSEYMLGNYRDALSYFSIIQHSENNYYKTLGMYWKGRCFEKINDKLKATSIYNSLIKNFKVGYYPYLASIRLGKISSLTLKEPEVSELGDIDLSAEMKLLAYSTKSKKLKKEVWNYITKKANSSNYKSYLNALHSINEFNLMIKLSYKFPSNNKYRYPRGYNEIIDKYSKEYNVDSSLVFALIREESLYDPKAKSWVGAKGLMQLMDKTAEALNKKLNIKSSIYSPNKNIQLGTLYLSELLSDFDNNYFQVLAAYNGGPNNVKAWKKRFKNLDYDEFVESIPFKETNGYVKRVLRSYFYYKFN